MIYAPGERAGRMPHIPHARCWPVADIGGGGAGAGTASGASGGVRANPTRHSSTPHSLHLCVAAAGRPHHDGCCGVSRRLPALQAAICGPPSPASRTWASARTTASTSCSRPLLAHRCRLSVACSSRRRVTQVRRAAHAHHADTASSHPSYSTRRGLYEPSDDHHSVCVAASSGLP